ncbi:MAG: uracil-DNA glycosylase family protein [Thermoplasmatota archaeon]
MRFDERLDPLLEEIADKVITCTKCDLAEGRLNAVPGEGPQHAEIMFVGEAPGAKEDETGRPFVGQSGKLFTELLESAGIKREDVFITSIIKCRPPDNRDPTADEVKACAPYVLTQLDSISPVVLVTMGNVAYDFFSSTFYLPKKTVGEVRGKVFRLHSTGCRFLIPTYHPAGLIYNRKLIPQFKEDMKKVLRYLKMPL